MPIRFTFSNEQADFPNAFARVLIIRINRLEREVDLRGGIWADQAASSGDRVLLKQFHYSVVGQPYNTFFSQANLQLVGKTPDSEAEEYLLTQAEFAGGVRV